jgi:tripartite-type tricarboxylate transporter receptor subunit TctC
MDSGKMLVMFPDCKFLRASARAAALTVALVASIAALDGWAQSRSTVKILVPYPPGSTPDIVARVLGEQIGRTQSVAFVVENRPGAAGLVGTEAAARAAADGTTVLLAANPFLIDPYLRKVSYDPLTSFEPICYLGRSPTVVTVNAASPYHTLAELFEAARARPGTLTLAGTGPASAAQLGFEMLKRAAKVDMTFVPYPGLSQALNALLGEHVTSVFGAYPPAAEHIKAGKLRALAAGSRVRIDSLPEVPTTAEAGYGDIEGEIWNWLLAPAGTPKEAVVQLRDWFNAAMQAPEVKTKLLLQGFVPVTMCGPEFAAYVRKQYEDYGRIIREANIKAQ